MLGIDLMQNFNFPYFSRNIGEFWRLGIFRKHGLEIIYIFLLEAPEVINIEHC